MEMEIELRPFSGYLSFPKAIIFLFLGNSFDPALMGTYFALLCEVIWDNRNPKYKRVRIKAKDLANRWKINESTVRRRVGKLEIKGLVKRRTGDGHFVYYLPHFEYFKHTFARELGKTEIANLRELVAETQRVCAEMQAKSADSHDANVQKQEQNFRVPYKSNLDSSTTDSHYSNNQNNQKLKDQDYEDFEKYLETKDNY